MITFDIPLWQVLQFVVAIVLPVVVGFVTTRWTDPGLKAILLLGLNLVTALGAELVQALQSGTEYNLGLALLLALGSFITGVALHYGLYKPTGVSGFATAHGRKGKHVADSPADSRRVPHDHDPEWAAAQADQPRPPANEPDADDYNRGNDRW